MVLMSVGVEWVTQLSSLGTLSQGIDNGDSAWRRQGGRLRPPDPVGTGSLANQLIEYLGNLGAPNIRVTPSYSVPALTSDQPLQTQTQNKPTNNPTAPTTT